MLRAAERIVDALPERLWAIGNLYMLPGGDWHFCVGDHPGSRHPVRTIEWRGREVVHGRRPFERVDPPGEGCGEWVNLWRWGYYPGRREPT